MQDQLKNVQEIQATAGVFAGILGHGTVVTWGNSRAFFDIGDSGAEQDQPKLIE